MYRLRRTISACEQPCHAIEGWHPEKESRGSRMPAFAGMTVIIKLFIVLLWIMPSVALPLSEDVSLPMHITADSTSFDYVKGTGLYEGNVIVSQGKTRLNADRLVTFNNMNHKIEKAIAYGNRKPARYVTLLSLTDKNPLFAQARIIRFYPFRSLVILSGNARVRHGEDQFQGPVAVYDMKNQTVNAPQSVEGRAKILIQPDQTT